MLTKLSEEVERLISDRYEVQQHLLRMEAWSENLSFWRTHIQSVHYHDENDILQVIGDCKCELECLKGIFVRNIFIHLWQ